MKIAVNPSQPIGRLRLKNCTKVPFILRMVEVNGWSHKETIGTIVINKSSLVIFMRISKSENNYHKGNHDKNSI